MQSAAIHDAEMSFRAELINSPSAFHNWRLSDRNAQTQALARVARIRSRRLRSKARRRLVNRLYSQPLPVKITTTVGLP